MSRKPAISIVTPTYNRRAALVRAIASVQAQTVGDYEHLIVDDCSQDGTDELVRQIGDDRIHYERFMEWQGANAARNRGVELARAKLVTFLDSDDEYLPTRLEATLGHFRVDPQLLLLISSFQTRKRGRICPSINPDRWLDGPELERGLMTYGIFIAGSCITVRRGHLLRAGGFDPGIFRLQDRELLLRLAQWDGARLLSEIDWIKHRSHDSISVPSRGYVPALGAMMARHRTVAHKYRALLCYHVARHMLANLTHGRLGPFIESYRANRAAPELRFTLLDLLQGYRGGSAVRHRFAAEIAVGESILPLQQRAAPADASHVPCSDQEPHVGYPLPLRILRAA